MGKGISVEVFSVFSEGPWGSVRFPAFLACVLTVADRILDKAECVSDCSSVRVWGVRVWGVCSSVWVWGAWFWLMGLGVVVGSNLFEKCIMLGNLLLPPWDEPSEVGEG